MLAVKVSRASALAFRIAKLLCLMSAVGTMLTGRAFALWSFGSLRKCCPFGAQKCETIALCGTRCVIIDIQAWSFTRVNSLRLQSQCLAITAFCKAPPKDKFYLSFWRPPKRSQCMETINPGLAPWAMQECRPVGALRRPQLNRCQYVVLIFVITRTYSCKYVYLFQ